ncbi:MAG: homocysteine S-methyltransferase family protein [Pyrinomonadaceae bacterium]
MHDVLTTGPGSSEKVFLTDGGLETTLIFLEGWDLPSFAAFDLLKGEAGTKALKDYYLRYLNIAKEHDFDFILETPTWRANPDWVEKVGYSRSETSAINQKAAGLMHELKKEFSNDIDNIFVSGCIGPRGDGYSAETNMTAEEARAYHSEQVQAFRDAEVDLISAITMTNFEEATGVALAANDANMPVVISFTVETDGKLPSGASLKDAIESVDRAADTQPIYYMINCAHPAHFADVLDLAKGQPWTTRIKGLRSNASKKSHAELDESTELDRGDLQEFGSEHKRLAGIFSDLSVFGGCCGTDDEHVLEIAKNLRA